MRRRGAKVPLIHNNIEKLSLEESKYSTNKLLVTSEPEEVKYLDDFDPKNIRLCSWNVNGLKSIIAKGELQQFIREHSPDVLCLSETKLSLENIEKLKIKRHIPGEYGCYWNCSKTKKGYSGTAILTKGNS